MSAMPTHSVDSHALLTALASQGYAANNQSFISRDHAKTGTYFQATRHEELGVAVHIKYDHDMKFHSIENLEVYTLGLLEVYTLGLYSPDQPNRLTTNPHEGRYYSENLELIVDEANEVLLKNIEYDGFVRPDYAAALVAETIEDAYNLYHQM